MDLEVIRIFNNCPSSFKGTQLINAALEKKYFSSDSVHSSKDFFFPLPGWRWRNITLQFNQLCEVITIYGYTVATNNPNSFHVQYSNLCKYGLDPVSSEVNRSFATDSMDGKSSPMGSTLLSSKSMSLSIYFMQSCFRDLIISRTTWT